MTDNRTTTAAEELRTRMTAEAEAIAAAETDEDDCAPLPGHVKVSRPNRARSKVLQVRLNPDEYDALEAVAAMRDLPVSTIAREQILGLLREHAKAAAATGDQVLGLLSELAEVTEKLQQRYRSMRLVTAGPGTGFIGGSKGPAAVQSLLDAVETVDDDSGTV